MTINLTYINFFMDTLFSVIFVQNICTKHRIFKNNHTSYIW